MLATGTFDVELTPQDDGEFPAGRLLINKTYAGDMTGAGVGQMISKRTEAGAAAYFAIEEFTGSIDGKSGSLTLLHSGRMDKDSQSLTVVVLEGSGSGELESVSGSLEIIQSEQGHRYRLEYAL